jgi:hypothetical protein
VCGLGLFDVVPAGSLDGLTAEDFRLLLNGVGDINVATLISYTSFNDESGEPGDRYISTSIRFVRFLSRRSAKVVKYDSQL